MCERLLVALTQMGGLWNLDITIICRPSEVWPGPSPREGVYGSSITAPHTEAWPHTPQAQCLGPCLTCSSLPA